MKKFAKNYILKVKPYRPGKPIDEVKREMNLKQVVKLASNECPYGPSPRVLKAIGKEAKNINRYPDGGCFYLRKDLAKRLKISEQQLVFGNGSDEIIVLAIRAYIREGDEIIVTRPSFLIYEIAGTIAGATIKAVPAKNFRYNIDGMLKAVTKKTKIIFIANPDNPLGTYLSAKEIEKLLRKVRSDVLVFIDEAYFEYVTAKDYPQTIQLVKRYKNLVVTRTFSKIYGLAGLRVGYGIAAEEVADIFNRIREPFNVDSLAQAAARACLQDQRYYQRIAKKTDQQKRYLYAQLSALGLFCVKSETNFILIDVQKKSAEICQGLLKQGVIVRDMGVWGLNTFIRVTVGTEKENQKFIRALKRVL